MDAFLQEIYLGQVKDECEQCFRAIAAMNAIIERGGQGDFFQHALDLVHHAASISRIFWPPGGRNKNSTKRAHRRGQFLRDLLALSSGHSIQDRTLRDHFEHFDERLDAWAESSRYRNIVQRFIGPRSAFGGNAIEDGDIIHHYDPGTRIFCFRGERFDIQALASGVDDIFKKVMSKLAELEANKRLQATRSKQRAPEA
jgi:hypothetical protein